MPSSNRYRPLRYLFLLLSCGVRLYAESRELRFELDTPGEVIAEITASAPSTSWERSGAEAAVATVYVDGRYNQDLILFQGSQPWTYRVFLGPLEAGTHGVRVVQNSRWSAPGAGLRVDEIRARVVAADAPGYRALAHAPILYARADTLGRFSDVPLLIWYEQDSSPEGEVLQYSVIFSNEDGGTPTDALMARWGRATDIEYVYRVRLDSHGDVQEELFQGPSHKEATFRGRRMARHPYLLIATRNNMFVDTGFSPLQFHLAPVGADLDGNSREELMDRFPWTYRIMAQELEREGKLRPYGVRNGPAVSDPRQYLYVELRADHRTSGSTAWVKLKGQSRWHSSHKGRDEFAISRNGLSRTTVELPPGTAEEDIELIAFQCLDLRGVDAGGARDDGKCDLQEVEKVFLLDSEYRPGRNLLRNSTPLSLRPGEMVAFPLGGLED